MKNTEIKVQRNMYVDFDFDEVDPENIKNMLILGNTDGLFGVYKNGELDPFDCNKNIFNIIEKLHDIYENRCNIYIIGNKVAIEYYQNVFYHIMRNKRYNNIKIKTIEKDEEYIETINKIYRDNNMPKFDYIIQNPPYNRTFHFEFLEKGLDILSEDGKMVIIEPATWLINLRKNGNAKRYNAIKKRLNRHVKSVRIENLNKEFGISSYVPLAITTIDKSKEFETIDFLCCGEHKVVNSLYNCNLIGDYNRIWNVFDKITSNCDLMHTHILNENTYTNDDTRYVKFSDMISYSGCVIFDPQHYRKSVKDWYIQSENTGEHLVYLYSPAIVKNTGEEYIHSSIPYRYKNGSNCKNPKYSDKYAACVYGSQDELENWKYFTLNNSLPLFINICLTINQINNSRDFLPWLVDKRYTDDEINTLFNFTPEEVNLINYTVEKFERNSPWFKRYMCGPSSDTDEEVQSFIDNLKAKYNIA